MSLYRYSGNLPFLTLLDKSVPYYNTPNLVVNDCYKTDYLAYFSTANVHCLCKNALANRNKPYYNEENKYNSQR